MMDETELYNVYFQMKSMSLTQLYNLREIAIKQDKKDFLKLIDLVIKNRNQDKLDKLII